MITVCNKGSNETVIISEVKKKSTYEKFKNIDSGFTDLFSISFGDQQNSFSKWKFCQSGKLGAKE